MLALTLLVVKRCNTEVYHATHFSSNIHTGVGHYIDQPISLSTGQPAWLATWILLILPSAASSGAEALNMALLPTLVTDHKSLWTIYLTIFWGEGWTVWANTSSSAARVPAEVTTSAETTSSSTMPYSASFTNRAGQSDMWVVLRGIKLLIILLWLLLLLLLQ